MWPGITTINLLFIGKLSTAVSVSLHRSKVSCSSPSSSQSGCYVYFENTLFSAGQTRPLKLAVVSLVQCCVSFEEGNQSGQLYFFQRGFWIQTFTCMYARAKSRPNIRVNTKTILPLAAELLLVCRHNHTDFIQVNVGFLFSFVFFSCFFFVVVFCFGVGFFFCIADQPRLVVCGVEATVVMHSNSQKSLLRAKVWLLSCFL